MTKQRLKRVSVAALLVFCLLVGTVFTVLERGGRFLFASADAINADTTIDSDTTYDADTTVENGATLTIDKGKTLTIASGTTLTIAAGAKLVVSETLTVNAIPTATRLIVNGTLEFEDGADSDIKGEVRVNAGGVYNDKNANANWAWKHGGLSGKIVMQEDGELMLNNTLYVGKQAGAYITVSTGNWTAQNNADLDRFIIEDGDVYAMNGVTYIYKTLADTRTWHVGKDAHINLCANNRIKFVGSGEGKSRINTYDPNNAIYYGATNTLMGNSLLSDSNYSWVGGKWAKVGPYMGMNGFDMDALMGLIGELSIPGYDFSEKHGGSTWNGVSWKSESLLDRSDPKSDYTVPTNDAGVDGIRYRDIKYSDRGGTKDGLDLYIPAGYQADDAIPLVVHMYGGGWTGGTKNTDEATAARFAKMGYAVAVVDYRLAGLSGTTGFVQDDGNFFDMVNDIEDSVVAARKKIEELGYKTSYMATTGGSAGAHLSMMYAYTHGEDTRTRFEKDSEHEDYTDDTTAGSLVPVKFAMTNCGPTDFSPEAWQHSASYVPYYDEEGRLLSDEGQLLAGAGLATGLQAINGLIEPDITVTTLPANYIPLDPEDLEAGTMQDILVAYGLDYLTPESGAATDFDANIETKNGKDILVATAKITVIVRAKGEKETDEDYKKVVDAATEKATAVAGEDALQWVAENYMIPWTQEAQTINIQIAPAAMIEDAINNPSSIYHNVPTLGLYGGQDTLCSPDAARKLMEVLDQDAAGRHLIVFSPLMGHTLAEDSTAMEANYDKTNECLDKYLRPGTNHVVFKADGVVIGRFDVETGTNFDTEDAPEIPSKTGYEIQEERWDNVTYFEGDPVSNSLENIQANVTVNAKYIGNPYKIIFKAGDTVLDTKIGVYQGKAVGIPAVPEKEGYIGAWDSDDFTFGASDRTITAVYTQKTYTITFMDGDTVVAEKTVAYGGTLTDVPAVPSKSGQTGVWNITDYSDITDNMVVEAVYSESSGGCNSSAGAVSSIVFVIVGLALAFVLLRKRRTV